MAATYDPLLPTDRDWLRFQLGDVDTAEPLIADETYDRLLSENDDRRLAGAEAATALAARFAQEPDQLTVTGEISLSWRPRVETWIKLAATWRSAVAVVADGGATGGGSLAPEREHRERAEYSPLRW